MLIGVRMPPDQLARLDVWIIAQPGVKPTRPEAIRRLVDVRLGTPIAMAGVRAPQQKRR
jgi:hypothetical protein